MSASSAKAGAIEAFHKLPMSFEANQGQTDERVKFISRGAGYTLFLTGDGAVMKIESATAGAPSQESIARPSTTGMPYVGNNTSAASQSKTSAQEVAVLNMQVVGANPAAAITASGLQRNTSNYFIGNDHSKWRTKVPNFGRVRYTGIYPGVDVVYYGHQGQLEYDFVVSAGSDPDVIALRFSGGGDVNPSLTVDENGDLVAHLSGGGVRFHKPVVYQADAQQHKNLIDGRYMLSADGAVRFEIGAYDHGKELVIDPAIFLSTYVGGSKADAGLGVAVDSFGSPFITGSTLSTDFPTLNPLYSTNAGGKDIFITKLDGAGDAEVYSTYVGGSADDVATDILLDNLGDMTVTGYTLSKDFPLELPIQPTFGGGTVTGDAFVFQIASHGTAFVYSTYLGGSSDDQGFSLALDSSNNVYVVGYTSSNNFPVTPGAFQTSCGMTSKGACSNGFVLKITVPPGQGKQTTLTYSSYLGGSGGLGDAAYGIWVDNTTKPAPGYAYVVGIAGSPNFPVTSGAFDQSCGTDGKCNGTYDGFVTEVNPAGSALVFSTFLGSSGYDYAAGVAVDATGVYVSGNTTSTNFPVTSTAAQKTFGGMSKGCVPSSTQTCGDVTITKLNPTGSGLLYSTYLGGSLDENPGMSLALDAGGSVYVTGQTDSVNFPVVTPLDQKDYNGATYNGATYGGGASDAFLTKLNPQGTAFAFSTYIGGSGADSGSRVILDQFASAYISGTTTSTNLPTMSASSSPPFQNSCASCGSNLSDAFVFKVSTSAALSLAASAPKTVASGANITYTITSGNTGPDGASAVSITDPVPAGLNYVSSSVSPNGSCALVIVLGQPDVVTCAIGYQTVGERVRASIVFNVTAKSGATIKNIIGDAAANGSNTPSATLNTTVN